MVLIFVPNVKNDVKSKDMVYSTTIKISTKGICDIVDITNQVEGAVIQSKIKNGIITIFSVGSTLSVTTIEMNANLEEDLAEALEIIAPSKNKTYHHDKKWGDGNGFSHVRASLLGPSTSVPIIKGKLTLGTWQQLVVIDFDNRPRDREIVIQVVGD